MTVQCLNAPELSVYIYIGGGGGGGGGGVMYNIMSSILFSALHCLLSASGVCFTRDAVSPCGQWWIKDLWYLLFSVICLCVVL